MTMHNVVVSGSFDNMRSKDIRFLQEAARLGQVQVLVWDDEVVCTVTGQPPKFPLAERSYLLQALRYVNRVAAVSGPIDPQALPQIDGSQPTVWAVPPV